MIVDNALTIGVTPTEVAQGIAAEDFNQIVRQHQRRVYRVLFVLLGDADSADTLTQECFLRAYRKRGSFRGECRLDTWLLKIAINLAHDYRRSRRNRFWKRLIGLDDHNPDEAPPQFSDPRGSPERALLAQRQLQAVWTAADGLPARQRAIFLLRFAEEMTLSEIAAVTGLKPGSVKTHLFRAIGTIRTKMKEQQWT